MELLMLNRALINPDGQDSSRRKFLHDLSLGGTKNPQPFIKYPDF